MNKYFVPILLFLVGMSSIAVTSAGARQGLWRMETSMEMKGMPMQLPAQTTTVCIKKKDYIPTNKKMPKDCKEERKVDGSSITWQVNCPSLKMVQKGSIKYTGRRMQGSIVTTVHRRGKKSVMTAKIKGQYLGSCKK